MTSPAPSLNKFLGGGPALIETYLGKQQDLTAVQRFSTHHDEMAMGGRPALEGRYRDLIPLERPKPGWQFAFEVDLDRCSGCKACVTACHNLNGLDEHETWRAVGLIHNSRGMPLQQTVTTACQHCLEPGCSHGCPVKAYEKDAVTGIVRHLDDQCIGCEYCILKCPYDVPQYHHGKGIVRKCDMCAGRLEAGEAPACVQACPTQAIRITVVEQAQVRANPTDYATLPGAPDARYTLPTTRYKTVRRFPEGMEAANAHDVRREKAHFPLVFMLSVSQMAVGFCVAVETATLLGGFSSHPLFQALGHGLGAAFTLIAIAISVAHLGRPLYAFRALLGFRRSWLSREIAAFGLMASLAMAAAGASLIAALPATPLDAGWAFAHSPLLASLHLPYLAPLALWMRSAMEGGPGLALHMALAVSGAVVVHCSAMVYRDTPRIFWMGRITSAKFFLSAAASGSAMFLAFCAAYAAFAARHGLPTQGLREWMLGSVAALPLLLAAKLGCEAQVQRHVDDQDPNSLKKAALLLRGALRPHHVLRFNAGLLGGMLLPALWLYRGVGVSPVWDLTAGILAAALVLGGECMERFLFFAACVPPRMPGS